MKNGMFLITHDPENGTIRSIVNPQDRYGMNWCADGLEWGRIRLDNYMEAMAEKIEMRSISFEESDNCSKAVYSKGLLNVTAERFFDEAGCLNERYTVHNPGTMDVFVEHGEMSIAVPFNDVYTDSGECLTNRCHAHIWCGHHSAFVRACKMGKSDINLGLVLVRGAIDSYSVNGCQSNHRGEIVFDIEHLELLGKESYVLEWKLFWYRNEQDFEEIAHRTEAYIGIEAEHQTVFLEDNISFTFTLLHKTEKVRIVCMEKEIPYSLQNARVQVIWYPRCTGEHRFLIFYGDRITYADFIVKERFPQILKKRVRFIREKQQYNRAGSHLDGGYLIYDNAEKNCIFDAQVLDHNACRERVGMALLVVKYLQKYKDDALMDSLKHYITFMKREFFEEETGEVFGNVGKDRGQIRLYNAPWLITLFTELYSLTKDKNYLISVLKMLQLYYDNDGYLFYPNGLSMFNTVQIFRQAGMEKEGNTVQGWFRKHVEHIIKNGTDYPRHEVNFEQTIVSPAVTFICQMGRLTRDLGYASEAKKHLEILERFSGHQPSFHMKEIPIRYWDGFWFGKSRLFGDTFPHYWSCLTARGYMEYYWLTGDEHYRTAAEECIRNCLCLFNKNGEGSCAYIFPFRSNGCKGAFYDEWANDQDYALYFALDLELFY